MPDVCISFWDDQWKTDMMLKVTDICSTDPANPVACKQPGDIKVDRSKVGIWSHSGPGSAVKGNMWTGGGGDGGPYSQDTVWFFRKCWDDVRPPHRNSSWLS